VPLLEVNNIKVIGSRFSADVTLGHLTRWSPTAQPNWPQNPNTLPGSGMHGMSGFG
jgi:hypothetical protein